MNGSVRIPSDVDRPDTFLAGLTARQLAYLVVAGLFVAALWHATSGVLAPPVFVFLATPVVAAATVLAVGRRDGVGADLLVLRWLRHTRSNARRVAAPEGLPGLPAWARTSGDPIELDSPLTGVDEQGVLELADQGAAVVCRASSLNFGLRTPEEQAALVAVFAHWLNSLADGVQIVVRAEPVDVRAAVRTIEAAAPALPHPALEAAAREHASYLAEVASRRDVLRRVVLVVFRDASGDAVALARRVDEAAKALAGAGVSLTPTTRQEALDLLGRSADREAVDTTGVVRGTK